MTGGARLLPLLLMLLLVSPGCTTDPDALTFSAIVTPAKPRTAEPNLSLGRDGRIHMTWLHTLTPTRHSMRLSTWNRGRWSPPLTVSQGDDWFVNWADFPSLIEFEDGTLAAHWLRKTGEETYAYEVQIAFSFDGGRLWRPPVVPHRDGTKQEHGFVSLLPGPGGTVEAMWIDGRKHAEAEEAGDPSLKEMSLRHVRIDKGGGLGEETVLDPRVCECCQTSAAVTSGGLLIAYRDRSPDEIRDISVVRRVDGQWTEPATIHDDGWETTGCPVNGPAVAVQGSRVGVAWFTAAGDRSRVLLALSEDGGATFGAPVVLDEGSPEGRVDLVFLPDGATLTCWLRSTADGADLLVRRTDATGKSDAPREVVATTAERSSGFPQLATNGREVLLAYTQAGEPSKVRVLKADITR